MWSEIIPQAMKKIFLLVAVIAAMALGACKTTEANYKAAYEAAKIQQRESADIDSTIYGKIRRQGTTMKLAVGADTLPIRTEAIGYTDGGGVSRETVKRYNIVVGQFKQVFNARQMRERLMAGGYPDAFIIHTREPLYYVVTQTVATPKEALAAYERVKGDRTIVLRDPLPFVLRPAHLAR